MQGAAYRHPKSMACWASWLRYVGSLRPSDQMLISDASNSDAGSGGTQFGSILDRVEAGGNGDLDVEQCAIDVVGVYIVLL